MGSKYDRWSTKDLKEEIRKLQEKKKNTSDRGSISYINGALRDIAKSLHARGE